MAAAVVSRAEGGLLSAHASQWAAGRAMVAARFRR
jgi:hypothetical protein